MGYDTAAAIINDAAVELGLRSTDTTDPVASSDALDVQLMRLLKSVGQRLVRAHDWSHLSKTHTFATVNGTGDYALPADYARMVNDTQWNRTGTSPLYGPVPAGHWAHLKSVNTTGPVNKTYRVLGSRLYVHPVPTAVETFALDYISKYWVRPTAQASATAETVAAATDELQFDRLLLVAGLKFQFLRAKNLDATQAWEDFKEALGFAIGDDTPAGRLPLDGGVWFHALDWHNVPEGSW